ncbi:MAG: PIN domain-containing protein [Chloroflexia bacterium]|nr:PIN domain-containing protein [Chloroflexia bacterium]
MSESAAPRAFVDTNVFVSGTINPHGRPRQILRAWHEGRFGLILSDRQHAELITVFGRRKIIRQFRITLIELTELIARIAVVAPIVPSSSSPVSLRDPRACHALSEHPQQRKNGAWDQQREGDIRTRDNVFLPR